MYAYYKDMCNVLAGQLEGEKAESKNEELKIGVFFCGPPVIGVQLADQCRGLSAR